MQNLTNTEKERDLIEVIMSARDSKNDWRRSERKIRKTIHGQSVIAKNVKIEKEARQELKNYREANK